MKTVELFTDGACSGNPGPGGLGIILKYKGTAKEISEGYKLTTNNRMELLAAIKGLEALKEPCQVKLYSDSKYLVDAIQKGWLKSWISKGWKKADKKPVLNQDLWLRISELLSVHNVEFIWVKGHDGHTENERCDTLATTAAASSNLLDDELYDNQK
ncbi:MAG: ribonuclease HI [Bacillota bacterium]|nr:ribonuclease HI [Bacillota bacterium]